MSLVLSIRFLTGRFHATPWNHQVNEGIVESPPSVWRILRALVSAYYYLPERPPRPEMCQLVATLANSLPAYEVPPYTMAHTRHYMPLRKEGKETTTKVLDSFIVFGRATTLSKEDLEKEESLAEGLKPEDICEIKVVWENVTLEANLHELLERLCENVTYLGRAESWCELSISEDISKIRCNVQPTEANAVSTKTTSVLAPLGEEALVGFKAALANVPKPKRAKWTIPQTVLEALEVDIGDLHRQGWSGVPGARWVTYSLGPTQVQRSNPQFRSTQAPTLARFDLDAKVLPPVTETLIIGERFRQALMSLSNTLLGEIPATFSGRDENGKKIGQSHAWYLPEDSNGDNRIDRVWVFAATGFSDAEILVLKQLQQVWSGKAFNFQTLITGLGHVEDYIPKSEFYRAGQTPSIINRSRVWRSLTPFVLPRHPKKKIDPETGWQVDGVEDQALRLLAQLHPKMSVQRPCEIRVDSSYSWSDFRRRRLSGKGHKSSDRGYWVELKFQEEQQGPIAIGYGAHYGLGLFVPA